MTDYKALFLDIDGTILQHNGTIDKSVKEAIWQVQQIGVEVFLATGRPIHEIASLANKLNIQSFIGYNGAYATYRNEIVVNEPMKETTVRQFIDTAAARSHDLLLYTSTHNIFTSFDSPIVKEMISYLNFQHNKLLSPGDERGVLSGSLINLPERELKFYDIDDEIHFSPVLSSDKNGKNFYDIIRDNVTKGSAIRKLLNRLGFPIESSIAFGDGMNDKEMLAAVGEGFAMGNAHPLLFDYANHYTTDVNNAGVYNGLKTLGLIK